MTRKALIAELRRRLTRQYTIEECGRWSGTPVLPFVNRMEVPEGSGCWQAIVDEEDLDGMIAEADSADDFLLRLRVVRDEKRRDEAQQGLRWLGIDPEG